MHCQNLITSPLVQSASFSLKSLQHPCEPKENLQCKVKNIHRQISSRLYQKTVGCSEESWYSWINKKACPFSLIAPLAMTDTLLAEGFMPRPRSLFRQHLPQLRLCSEPLRHMLIGGHMTLFFSSFLIPPYVCMAHMTSLLSLLLHPDTITHFPASFSFGD